MKTAWKAALAVLAVAGATAATPAAAQSFGLGFGPQGGINFSYDSGGYCDAWGCPDDFWDMPVYYGPVFWGGEWYDGPVYYRDWYGRRQFWIHGAWRFDDWRGPHPSWWREGRFGPALGENFYRSNGFHGRWDGGFGGRDDRRGFDQRRDFGPRDDRQNFGRDFGQPNDRRNFGQPNNGQTFGQQGQRRDFSQPNDRQNFGQGGLEDRRDNSGPRGNGGFDNRGAQPQAAPQAQPDARSRGDFGRGGNDGLNYRGRAMDRTPAAPQAAPQRQAAPQAAPPPDNGDGGRRGRNRNQN